MTARELHQRLDAAMLSVCAALTVATLAVTLLTVAHHYRKPVVGCVYVGNAMLMGCP